MRKFAFVIYRKWAYEILKNIKEFRNEYNEFEIPILITTPTKEFSLPDDTKVYVTDGSNSEKIYEILQSNKIDVVLFYGWSWIVEERILDNFLCLCLHPSPLPKYRGGTPIQQQILNGEKRSAVSVFKMSEGVDSGDIYMQLPMSLEGDINDLFKRMIDLGTKITKKFVVDFIAGKLKFTPQKDLNKYPPFKRREPQDSQIKLDDIERKSFEDIYNLVRGLLDPFPNAYILLNSQKLTIQGIKKYKKINKKDLVISRETRGLMKDRDYFFQVSDGYVKLVKYKLENL